jgi:hypothetical protein
MQFGNPKTKVHKVHMKKNSILDLFKMCLLRKIKDFWKTKKIYIQKVVWK